jgi:hypothetical protein
MLPNLAKFEELADLQNNPCKTFARPKNTREVNEKCTIFAEQSPTTAEQLPNYVYLTRDPPV